MKKNETTTPTAIPAEVQAEGRRWLKRWPDGGPWGKLTTIPASGIPVRFTGRGTIRAGVIGWIINGAARIVYLGEQSTRTEIGEFVILVESGGQVAGQLGRDFDFFHA